MAYPDRPRAVLTTEQRREKALEILEKNKAFLANPGTPVIGEQVTHAKQAVAVAEMHLEILDKAIQSAKERGDKPPRLEGRYYFDGIRSTLTDPS